MRAVRALKMTALFSLIPVVFIVATARSGVARTLLMLVVAVCVVFLIFLAAELRNPISDRSHEGLTDPRMRRPMIRRTSLVAALVAVAVFVVASVVGEPWMQITAFVVLCVAVIAIIIDDRRSTTRNLSRSL